jgi:hypothetical protein
MTGTQLQNAVAFWQMMTALGLSLSVESFCLAPGQVCHKPEIYRKQIDTP